MAREGHRRKLSTAYLLASLVLLIAAASLQREDSRWADAAAVTRTPSTEAETPLPPSSPTRQALVTTAIAPVIVDPTPASVSSPRPVTAVTTVWLAMLPIMEVSRVTPTPSSPTVVSGSPAPEKTGGATSEANPVAVSPPAVAGTSVTAAPAPTVTAIPASGTASLALTVTPDGVSRTLVVPILMYHHVAEPQPGWDRIRQGLTVSPAALREQLAYLKAAGYQTVSLTELVAALQHGGPLPPRPLVITFDDGYRDNYTTAFPLLKAFGFRATFFLVTQPIDQDSPDFLTWAQVTEMHAAGMEIGGHSYTHPDLRNKSRDYLIWQILGNKQAIEQRTGEPVRFFAYPSGEYDDNVIAVLKEAGFWGAVTTLPGCTQRSDQLWTLRRVRVTPWDTVQTLAGKLSACP